MKHAALAFAAAIVAAIVMLTASASAGRKDGWQVVVNNAGKAAYGSLGSARNSADGIQQIGCAVAYDYVNRRNQVTCTAVDAAGVSASCISTDPNMVQIGTAVSSDSWVYFRWDQPNVCLTIQVTNSSTHLPKAP